MNGMRDLAAALRRNNVGQIEILHVPYGFESPLQFRPSDLPDRWLRKLVIRLPKSNPAVVNLARALEATSVAPGKDAGDVRWGLVFYDLSLRKVGALWLDESGARGAVGEAPALFSSPPGEQTVLGWLETNCMPCMQ